MNVKLNRINELLAQIEHDDGEILISPTLKIDSTEKFGALEGAELLSLIPQAECFILDFSEGSEIYNLDPAASLFRLPYQVIWLQLEAAADNVTQYFALASQYEDDPDLIKARIFVRQANTYALLDSVAIALEDDGKKGLNFLFCARYADFCQPRYTEIHQETIEIICVNLGRFLTAINCSNVETRIQSGPKTLNQKRTKKNKPTFPAYRELTINLNRTPTRYGGGGGGGHASPRLHLRRGHVRRLSDGRHIWVRDTVVGINGPDNGAIEKHYRITDKNKRMEEA